VAEAPVANTASQNLKLGADRHRKRAMKNFEEKREFKRYEGRDDRAPFVAVRPEFMKIGVLKDVSLGGLGFKYTLMEGQEPLSDKEAHVSSLFVTRVIAELAIEQLRSAGKQASTFPHPRTPHSFHPSTPREANHPCL